MSLHGLMAHAHGAAVSLQYVLGAAISLQYVLGDRRSPSPLASLQCALAPLLLSSAPLGCALGIWQRLLQLQLQRHP